MYFKFNNIYWICNIKLEIIINKIQNTMYYYPYHQRLILATDSNWLLASFQRLWPALGPPIELKPQKCLRKMHFQRHNAPNFPHSTSGQTGWRPAKLDGLGCERHCCWMRVRTLGIARKSCFFGFLTCDYLKTLDKLVQGNKLSFSLIILYFLLPLFW